MTIFTYARVSTLDQDTGYQMDALKAAYPDSVYREEKKSGTSTKGREVLNLLLDMMGKDDKLVVWKLDRLARNVGDLCRIVDTLTEKGAALEILDQRIDTSTATGKAFLQMLGVFAEFETNLRKERQLAGIKKAKAKGIHMGRPKLLTDKQKAEIRDLYSKGTTPKVLAEQFKVSRATVYNVVRAGKKEALQ